MTANLEPTAAALGVADLTSKCHNTNNSDTLAMYKSLSSLSFSYFPETDSVSKGEIMPECIAGQQDLGKEVY